MVLVWSRLALALAAALLLAAPPAQAIKIHRALTKLIYGGLEAITKFGANQAIKYTKKELSKGYKNFAELASIVEIGRMMLRIVPRSADSVHSGVIPSMTDDIHSVIPISYKMNMPLFGETEPIDSKERYPFICHRKNATIKFTKCGSAGNGYQMDSRTGQCYKFVRKPATYIVANQNCLTHGGHLVVINSQTEAQVVRELYERNPEDTISGQTQKDSAFIGVFKNEADMWVTIDDYGKTLKEIGYDLWAPGQPNDARGDEICGSMLRNGLLQDEPCDHLLPYICERQTGLPLCPLPEKDERCDNSYY